SPRITMGRPVSCETSARLRARSTGRSATSGAGMVCDGGKRQRHEDEKQHEEFGIAEIVFELPGGEHGDDARDGSRGEKARLGYFQAPDETHAKGDDEREPD